MINTWNSLLGTTVGIICMVFVGVILSCIVPLMFFWVVKTLFGMTIILTLKTWLAAMVLFLMVGGTRITTK